jgi:hypothetical protein
MNKSIVLTIAAVLAAGCADRGVVDVSSQRTPEPSASLAGAPEKPGLTVMTWNVYYGTDPTPILVALQTNPSSLPFVVDSVWNLTRQTNFPERAGALARAIAAKRPHLVGVQEAALWRTGAFFGPPAEDTIFDFLSLLTDSLKARGLDYVIGATDATTDIELPAVDPTNGAAFDVRLTDRDAVLARADVPIDEKQAAKYNTFYQIGGLPPGVGIYEGWSSVVATVGGRPYRFVSTHLETQDLGNNAPGDIQQGQVAELLNSLLKNETRPTILVGDFNSDVYGKDPTRATPSYGEITAAGFRDSWVRAGGSPTGLTCCQNDSVSNKLPTFNQRVDFIFTRNMPTTGPAGTLGLAQQVVGDQRDDRTPSGLWPSDHGGVVATFLTPPLGPRFHSVTE